MVGFAADRLDPKTTHWIMLRTRCFPRRSREGTRKFRAKETIFPYESADQYRPWLSFETFTFPE